MMLKPTRNFLVAVVACAAPCMHSAAIAQEPESRATAATAQETEPKTVLVFDTLTLSIPKSWKASAAQSRIIEHEFSAALDAEAQDASAEDAPTARVTMMAAGGSVEQNIDRWKGQFTGGEEPKVERIEAETHTVHLVELSGTFADSVGGGPFFGGRTVERPDYGMLGAILEMKDGRTYFIKLTGPEKVVEAQRESFKKMLKEAKAS